MDGSIRVSAKERKTLLQTYRTARSARRALILLLLAEGWSYRRIREATFVSPTMIAAVKRDFSAGAVVGVRHAVSSMALGTCRRSNRGLAQQ